MTIAESDGTRLAFIAETAIGTTPPTPAYQTLRFKGESIAGKKETVKSEEIRADKNISDILHVGTNVAGGISGELSYGTYDDLIESVFRGAWTVDVLKNGIASNSFSFEKTFEQGTTDSYIRYEGCFIDTLDLSISSKSIITADFGLLGLSASDGADAIITGATYTAATTTDVMTAGNEVGVVTIGALSATIKAVDLSFKSQNRGQAQIGSNDLAGIALGQFEVTGSLDLYFESIEIYNSIRAHDEVAITINLGSVTTEKYTLLLPACRLLEGDPIAGGNGQDVQFTVAFQAKFDSSEACSAKLTRAVV